MRTHLEKQFPSNRARPAAFLLSVLLIFNAPLAFATTELPEEVTVELAALDKARNEAITEAHTPIADLDKKYVAALARVRISAQEAGNLKKLLAVDEEIKRVKSGIKDGNTPVDAEVAQLRKTYTENLSQRELAVAKEIAEIDRLYAAGVARIVTELTKAGMIDEAKRVLEIKNSTQQVAKQVEGETKAADRVTPPPKAPKSIVGTTWRVQGPKDVMVTFMEDGTLKGATRNPIHTYKITGENMLRINWGKLNGGVEHKEYRFDDDLTTLTGIQDHTQWNRVAPKR